MLVFWTDCTDNAYRDVIVKNVKGIGKGIEYRRELFKKDKMYVAAKGEVVLAFGDGPLKLMQSKGHLAKNKGINKIRGHPIKLNHAKYLFTYAAGIVFFDMKKDSEIRWDIRLAERLARTKSLEPELGTYRWVKNFNRVIKEVKKQYKKTGKPVDVSLDTETMGLNPFNKKAKIVSLSLTHKIGMADVFYFLGKTKAQKKKIKKQIRWVCETKMISMKGANLKYDNVWMMEKWGIRAINFKMDTLVVGSLLDENRSNSLTNHTREYTALGGYDSYLNETYDKGHMELIPKKDLLPYAGGDTDGCLQVSVELRQQLKQERGLQNLYVNIIHPAICVLEEVEHRGLCVDRKEYAKLRKEVVAEINDYRNEIISMMPKKLRQTHADKDDLLVPTVLKEFLFTKKGLNLKPKMRTEKTKEPQMTKDHLMMFHDVPEAAAFYEVYSKLNAAEKTLNTYIDGFLNHLRSDDKFHPTYLLFAGSAFGGDDDDGGTVTGRSSAKDPAIQTVPKHTKYAKRLRKCFPAPKGYVMWSIDFDQGELKITACLAHEKEMIRVYKSGGDLHLNTGAKLQGITVEQFQKMEETDKSLYELKRKNAKSANFGLIYGMQENGYREYARTSFGLSLTAEQAHSDREAFFDTYKLIPWHEEYVAMARRDLQVTSPLGRIRHLPLINSKDWKVRSQAERQAVNSPVQSCLSDLCYWAMTKIRAEFTMDEVWIAGNTHDNLYGYVPEKYAIDRIKRMKEIMEDLPIKKTFHWDHQIPFTVSCEMGLNMAELNKLKF